ncbi:Cysteine-rich venom protein TEL1 [Turdus rufiventris]|nr:Cysteine-rich venom protein TEL1 [Turdus rufiventris]
MPWPRRVQAGLGANGCREMDLLTAIIFLAALLHQSDGQGFKNIEMNAFSLPHFKTPNEKLILELHNQIRRAVIPTARNMLKMVWSEKAAKSAQKWASQCEMKISPKDKRVINGVTCGENVLLSSYPRTWADTIQVWYSQSSNFKYGYGAISRNINVQSYTQPTLASIKTSLETAKI